MACGTGRHIEHLRAEFDAEGLDASEGMLEAARASNPGTPFHLGDMRDFDLGRTFDAVLCLFSSIGYAKTPEGLGRAVRAMARHVRPGGILVVEPWFTPADWKPGTVHASLVDEPGIKIARVNTSFAEERLSSFDLHHLVATPEGTVYFVERHEM
ncbi:MAG: class I SAM-dependent methyltransferase, partial [Planctomycetes bacterium]|nr:class I SAM-dependent methyltransferase [Planctomycetota bacterium]